MTDKPALSEHDLGQFTGTDTWWKHPLFAGLTYTDGIRHVAQTAGAYWLIEAIFSHQPDPKAQAEEFQVWTLTGNPKGGASLVMTDGNTGRAIIRQEIGSTDFPLDGFPERTFAVWLVRKVLMLTSEY
jgi:hypothetical protein